jgi:hypothetical protein
MFTIEMVSPSANYGSVEIEGFVNGAAFAVRIDRDTHIIECITLDDEIVYSKMDAFNHLDQETFAGFRQMVATQVRTTRVGR